MADALAGRKTSSPPQKFVLNLFDQYASSFDRHLSALGYEAPENLRAAMLNCYSIDSPFDHAVDLGCGTGLSGLAFFDLTEYLSGIDISANMIEKAAEKQIYDDLVAGDICQVLQSRQRKQYDLFIAADVLGYIGQLDDLFSAIRDRARDCALFVFSTESCGYHDYLLLESGRYAHSSSYIFKTCRRHDFILECRKEIKIRKDKGHWIVGDAYITRTRTSKRIRKISRRNPDVNRGTP